MKALVYHGSGHRQDHQDDHLRNGSAYQKRGCANGYRGRILASTEVGNACANLFDDADPFVPHTRPLEMPCRSRR